MYIYIYTIFDNLSPPPPPLEEETTTLNSNGNSDCDQSASAASNLPPPFRRNNKADVRQMRLWPPLWQDTSIIVFHLPPSSLLLVCFALSVARTARISLHVYNSFSRLWIESTIEFSSKSRVFLSLSLFFVHLQRRRDILYFSKSTINFYGFSGDGCGGRRKKEGRGGGWKFQLDSISG